MWERIILIEYWFPFPLRSMVLYSRKFPSGTFEQISHLVKEVVSLTEACCAEEADPDCYDNRVGFCGLAGSVVAHRQKAKTGLYAISQGNPRQQLHLLQFWRKYEACYSRAQIYSGITNQFCPLVLQVRMRKLGNDILTRKIVLIDSVYPKIYTYLYHAKPGTDWPRAI